MSITEADINVLEEIIKEQGDCLSSKRCKVCPFRAMCLPEFLNPIPPSQQQRFKIAGDILAHHALIEPYPSIKTYSWDPK